MQGYLNPPGADATVRIRIAGEQAWLTIKGPARGISRSEFEYSIPLADAHEMLDSLSQTPLIEKTRHVISHRGLNWELDVFTGANAGLILAEIELESEDDEMRLPDWVGEEVSNDPRYRNSELAIRPWSQWGS